RPRRRLRGRSENARADGEGMRTVNGDAGAPVLPEGQSPPEQATETQTRAPLEHPGAEARPERSEAPAEPVKQD
ncbi:MAG TPA: hypothetical protein VFN52_04345, partial [Acidiferrobacteraceae bacterium]|nr:hypothetical protein [Acidiferrobacteraceae bacterium]